jgi:micrococcal nuclease
MDLRSRAGQIQIVAMAVLAGLLAAGCVTTDTPTLGSPTSRRSDAGAGTGSQKPDGSKPGSKAADRTKDKTGKASKGEGSERPQGGKPKPVDDKPAPAPGTVMVTDVVDGDTIEVSRASGSESIRLIGVDTPETVHPTEPIECYGPRASDFTSSALSGERVRLEFDAERRDHYGRLLAYVWLDGVLFNKRLVQRGFAEVTIYSPNDEYADVLYAAESRARSLDRGLWAACSGGEGNPGDKPDVDKAGGSKCDSNYTGVCVPAYPPDIDCSDVAATNFKSVGSDPHGFDGDDDGVACEG